MPDLSSRNTKVSTKSPPVSKSATTSVKSSRSSGTIKSSDAKRPNSKTSSRSPPRRRPRRKSRSSSESRSSASSSDSESVGSSNSDSSQSSKASPKKTTRSKDVKGSDRPKPSSRPNESLPKTEPTSEHTVKSTNNRVSREHQKKSIASTKEVDTKRAENTPRSMAPATTPESSKLSTIATKHSTTPATDTAVDVSVVQKNDVSVKQMSKTSKNGEPVLDKLVKERSKSPAVLPLFTRILVEKLTRNINKAHITEIFSVWGKIQSVDMPPDRLHPEFSRSYAYVTYETPSSAADAVNFMNGGQIDGEVVRVTEVLSRSSLLMRGEGAAVVDEKLHDRERETAKRESDRSGMSRPTKQDNLTTARRTGEPDERPRERERPSTESDRRRERPREHDRDRDRERERQRERDRSRERVRPRDDKSRRTRRGSSGSPFASRCGPPANRQRSPPGGSRYRRPSPPTSRIDTNLARRPRSRSPLTKAHQTSKPSGEAKPSTTRRGREASSRSSSSSSSGSDSSNSSSSTSRSGSSSSSSSSSSRSRS